MIKHYNILFIILKISVSQENTLDNISQAHQND